MFEVQTRSEENGIRNFPSVDLALTHSNIDKSIWKISFTITETGDRIRLVKSENGWVLESVFRET